MTIASSKNRTTMHHADFSCTTRFYSLVVQ